METKTMTSKEYFKAIQIVYYGLIAGLVLFAGISFYLHQLGNYPGSAELKDIFIYIVPLFVIGGMVGSNIIFKSRLKEPKKMTKLPDKMAYYRSALIVRYALLEGSAFFAIVVHLITGDLLFLGMAGLIILNLIIIKPTIEKAVNDLELDPNDRNSIYNPNTIIDEFNPVR